MVSFEICCKTSMFPRFATRSDFVRSQNQVAFKKSQGFHFSCVSKVLNLYISGVWLPICRWWTWRCWCLWEGRAIWVGRSLFRQSVLFDSLFASVVLLDLSMPVLGGSSLWTFIDNNWISTRCWGYFGDTKDRIWSTEPYRRFFTNSDISSHWHVISGGQETSIRSWSWWIVCYLFLFQSALN